MSDPSQTAGSTQDDEDEGLDYTGTSGMDIVPGTEHDDTIETLGGTDVVAGGAGDDDIDGGAGNDFLFGDSGADTIDGGEGDDVILGGSGADTLTGGAGADIIRGGSGADTLTGGEGDDILLGDSGADTIDGGAGDDIIYGGTGDDTLTGGAGADTFVFAPGHGSDTITDFDTDDDTINLSAFGDDISFDDLTITATSDGTGSIITVPGATAADNVTITLQGVATTDVTADIFEFDDAPDLGSNVLGTEGDDNLSGTQVSGGEGDDTITVTGTFMNYAHGGEGDDQITGGAGMIDILVGGEGDDTIDGGTGTNYVHGGEGDDTFVIAPGQTLTTIYDFTDGDDQIDLSNISGITGFDDLTITTDGDDAVIDLSSQGAGSVRLENVAVSNLDADDFVFASTTTDPGDGM
ncbi:MAG: calcium-binding protein [Spirochaetaceae bacterium]|nr:calcium-binding protein [Spirochaetaceae bacterium]